ncbi:MAG: acetate kinase [Candidatus Nanopelagicales bacterium]
MLVLVVNCGSSSLKYQLIDTATEVVWASGLAERIGEADSLLTHKTRIGAPPDSELVKHVFRGRLADHKAAYAGLSDAFDATGKVAVVGELVAVGHRVVQGADRFVAPTLVTPEVLDTIRDLIPLAPLHNPAGLAGLESAMALSPDVPHVAVFDTAFHATMPAAAYTYAIEREIAQKHSIRRYGFHGTSHQYVTRKAAEELGKPVEQVDLVTLHLGNGASACAVRGGKSVDTSMGMTPLEGLVMGTRSGDLDPAVVFHLISAAGLSAAEADNLLNKRSGMLGLCGQNDLREVSRLIGEGDANAELALAVYCHRIKKYIGAYLAVLGRADAIVFTAGVGENDPEVRRRAVAGLEMAGIAIDQVRNAETRGPSAPVDLSFRGAPIRVLVIPTNEELEIAVQTVAAITK